MFNYNKLNCGFKKNWYVYFLCDLMFFKKYFSIGILSDFIVRIYDVLKTILYLN